MTVSTEFPSFDYLKVDVGDSGVDFVYSDKYVDSPTKSQLRAQVSFLNHTLERTKDEVV